MKNKIKTCLFALIIMGVITFCITYKSKNEVITKTKKKKSNIAIMIKRDNEDDYFESTAKEISKGQYYNLEQARGPFEIDLNTLNLDVGVNYTISICGIYTTSDQSCSSISYTHE